MPFWKPARGTFTGERRARKAKVERQLREVYALVDARDHHCCRHCWRRDTLSHHHIQERSLLGAHTTANIVLLCFACHEAVQRNRLKIIGRNANRPLRFKWVAK